MGADILEPTNEWEVLRFRGNTLSVIYKNKHGVLNFTGEAKTAVNAFLNGNKDKWGIEGKKRAKKRPNDISLLVKRDGPWCFYCHKILLEHEMSIEHILSLCHGGSNHSANKVLACRPCNRKADNMPVIEKIKLREKMRRVK